jgi:probable F420-dependent oxidoreductase
LVQHEEASMKIGVVFPQAEIGSDPAVIKDFAQAVEGLGYSHLLVFDHVLGADPNREGGWTGAYTKDTQFHEPFVLFGYLAAATSRIELVTGVLVLPQRQTALVAKQAAEVDILSAGRLRLGIGTGWNQVEYEALNENFHNRGRRQAEQVGVLRRLWAEDVVEYTGKWHRIDRASINPRPGRVIPIWFGGRHPAMLRRMASLGDGWFPLLAPGDELRDLIEQVNGLLREAGRDRATFGIEGFTNYANGDPDRWRRQVDGWREMGASHVSVRTMNTGLASPRDHIEAIRRYKEEVG